MGVDDLACGAPGRGGRLGGHPPETVHPALAPSKIDSPEGAETAPLRFSLFVAPRGHGDSLKNDCLNVPAE